MARRRFTVDRYTCDDQVSTRAGQVQMEGWPCDGLSVVSTGTPAAAAMPQRPTAGPAPEAEDPKGKRCPCVCFVA